MPNIKSITRIAYKKDPEKGDPGPSIAYPFRGDYSASKTYYGNTTRIDVVKYNNLYYKALITAGEFSGKVPTDTTYWIQFPGPYENIATGWLFAEYANLAGLIFKNKCLISQSGTVNGSASTDYENANFIPDLKIDPINGIIKMGSKISITRDYGISLNDANGKIATKIIADTIGTIATLPTDQVINSMMTMALAWYCSAKEDHDNECYNKEFSLGALSVGDVIKLNGFGVDLDVPTDPSGYSIQTNRLQVFIEVYNGSTLVHTWSASKNIIVASAAELNESFTPGESITIDGTNYTSGTYKLVLRAVVTIDSSTISGATDDVICRGSYAYAITQPQQTIIGTDGFFTAWGENKYMFVSAIEGINLRLGNYGLRLTSSGLQKLNNGTWINL